jgi:hypothetical protein
MTDPRTPRTEAGRRLLDAFSLDQLDLDALARDILAIEAEASTLGSSERLAAARPVWQVYEEKVMHVLERDLPDHDPDCDEGWDQRGGWKCLRCKVISGVKVTFGFARPLADPALSDPDAERQRAIAALEFVEFCYRDPMLPDDRVCPDCGRAQRPHADGCIIAAALPATQEPER